jgi:hypothetical protein
MTLDSRIADLFQMDDATWARHANPWSVFTRALVLPLLIIAVWSRVWLGWWSLLLVAVALLWNWLNPRLFPAPASTRNWASQSVLGERVWINRNNIQIPTHHRIFPNVLNAIAALGAVFVIWGLVTLSVWPTVLGAVLTYAGKFWFLDRMVWLYSEMQDAHEDYRRWLY